MSELASYRLSDFILFSESVYYRQFELYNLAIWPLHLVAIIFALLILLYAQRNNPFFVGRLVAILLAVSWVWVAVAFLYQRLYQIHVVADWYAYGFVVQAGLIIWFGVIKNRFAQVVTSQIVMKIGLVLLWFSLVFYPLIAVISGRHWLQLEMFALAPDPTVVATIAILLLRKGPVVLYMMPVLWLVISAMTLSVM